MTFIVAKWTIEEYHRMIDAGILSDRKVELLKGEIAEISPEGEPHAYCSDGKDSGGRVLTKGTLEGQYHKYEPKPASRFRPRKLEPVVEGRTGRDNY
jgi:hypothetical protein